MRQRGKVLSHLMRFFRHAEHGLVLAGMSFIDGTERRDERWDEIIPYSRGEDSRFLTGNAVTAT